MSGAIPKHTLAEHTKAIGDFLPSGPVFQSAFNPEADLYKFLSGLSPQVQLAEELISDYQCEFFPDNTDVYLSEWERSLGMPDLCFTATGTAADRQRDIVCKILARGTQTIEGIQLIATKYGITVTIRKDPITGWPYTWPIVWLSPKQNRNTIYVSLSGSTSGSPWPWVWPHAWGGGQAIIKCLIEKLVSAQTKVIFE